MSRVLVDTSAYSAFFRGDGSAREAIQTAQELVFNPIVLGELLSGFGRGRRLDENKRGLDEFLSSSRVRVIAIDEETASRYAVILSGLRSAGTPIPTNDIWIAASAMQHGLEILTADAHFSKVVQVVVKRVDNPPQTR